MFKFGCFCEGVIKNLFEVLGQAIVKLGIDDDGCKEEAVSGDGDKIPGLVPFNGLDDGKRALGPVDCL